MAVEIEVKLKVEKLDGVRETLRTIGAQFMGEARETNRFFDRQDRSLMSSDRGLRLRTSRDTGDGGETHVITWKGPRLPGEFKSREEIEVTVDDAVRAAALLEKLGYAQTLSFEKRRESWKFGGCKIELDELPHFGFFVEIEGAGHDEIGKIRALLQLDDAPVVDATYVAMIAGLNVKGSDIRF